MRARGNAVGALVASGLVAYLALHFFEPSLAITWSFAHLGRSRALWWSSVALVALVPFVVFQVWERPGLAAPLPALRWPTVLVLGALASGLLAYIGLHRPAPELAPDTVFFLDAVSDPDVNFIPRWYLTTWAFGHVAQLAGGAIRLTSFIRFANSLVAGVALVALAGAAWRLASTRGEALAMTALAWTAFGSVQLGLGYIDVYPTVLAFVALYLWTGLRTVQGAGHPVWPLLLAAVGPFWYVGLVLLAPSTLLLAAFEARRDGGVRRLLVACTVAILGAGLATIPGYGAPFAWSAFAASIARAASVERGMSPTSSLLPWAYVVSAAHARELVHLFVLIDGVGMLLLATAGVWLAGRGWDPAAAFLAAVALPILTYMVVMDPIFGVYLDWDLFSYAAAVTSLAGGYAFIRWGRAHPRLFAPLLGLALAAAGVHLHARLNALDVARAKHTVESPGHDLPRQLPVRPPRR